MSGKKVLVVDDDVKTVELVKLYLNRDGYRVLTAYNGNDALQMARENHPDLIVLDGADRVVQGAVIAAGLNRNVHPGHPRRLPHLPGARYRDAWNDCELAPRLTGADDILSTTIAPQGVGCIVVTAPPAR